VAWRKRALPAEMGTSDISDMVPVPQTCAAGREESKCSLVSPQSSRAHIAGPERH